MSDNIKRSEQLIQSMASMCMHAAKYKTLVGEQIGYWLLAPVKRLNNHKKGVKAYEHKRTTRNYACLQTAAYRELAPFQVDGRKAHCYTPYKAVAERWLKELEATNRLEQLRQELRAERISYSELAELESLKQYIQADDVELLEAVGVPEVVR